MIWYFACFVRSCHQVGNEGFIVSYKALLLQAFGVIELKVHVLSAQVLENKAYVKAGMHKEQSLSVENLFNPSWNLRSLT